MNGTELLPAVAYIEIARTAGNHMLQSKDVKSFRNLSFKKAVRMQKDSLDIQLRINKGEWCSFGIGLPDEAECMGGEFSDQERNPSTSWLHIEDLIKQCESSMKQEQFYEYFKQSGFCYGELFRPILQIYFQDSRAVSKLCIQGINRENTEEINASVLEGALQTAGHLANRKKRDKTGVYLPYHIKELNLYHSLSEAAFVTAELVSNMETEFNISITDHAGEVLAEINGYKVKMAGAKADKVCYTTKWEQRDVEVEEVSDSPTLVFIAEEEKLNRICNHMNGQKVIKVSPAEKFREISPAYFEMDFYAQEDYNRLSVILAKYQNSGLSIIYVPKITEISKDSLSAVEETSKQMILPLFYINKTIRFSGNFCCRCFYPYKIPAADAVTGFIRSINLEIGKCQYKGIGFDEKEITEEVIKRELQDCSENAQVRYILGKRYIADKEKYLKAPSRQKQFITAGGVYWIIGGTGKIGMNIAKYLSKQYKALVIISGRTKKMHSESEASGAQGCIKYIQADITSKESVSAAYQEIKASVGKIDGIIHCAGVLEDALSVNKTEKGMWDILSPKVHGTVTLDEVTKDEDIKWMILFSSITAVFGNAGQSDYAYANCFLNGYAEYRNMLQEKGLRKGRTMAVNWPLVDGGRMMPSEQNPLYGRNSEVCFPMPMGEVFELLETLDMYEQNSITVLYGKEEFFPCLWDIEKKTEKLRENIQTKKLIQEGEIKKAVIEIAALITHMEEEEILPDTDLEYCGFDSVVMAEFVQKLQLKYKIDISPAFFFEIGAVTPDNICKYLKEKFGANVS